MERTKEQSQTGQTGLEPQNFSESASNITMFLSSRIPNYEDSRPFIDKKRIRRNFKKDYFEERKEISSIRSDIIATKIRRTTNRNVTGLCSKKLCFSCHGFGIM